MAKIDVYGLKATREALCASQSSLTERARSGIDEDRVPGWTGQLQRLIDGIDVHRPTQPDGKHGDAHTETCECEDSNA